MIQINLFIEQKQTHRLKKQTYDYQRRRVKSREDSEFGIDMYTLLYLKQITSKDQLHSTGKSAQYFLTT